MKFIPLLASFYLLSMFSAMAQMAIMQIAKPGDSFILQISLRPGDALLSEATYVISQQGIFKHPSLKQEIPGDNTHLFKNVGEGVWTLVHLVTVGGNVQHPGDIARRQGMTLMAAINKTGGFSKTADPSRVKLIRDKKETIYDLSKINPDSSNNPLLMDGDQIIVPASSAMTEPTGLLKPGDPVIIQLKKPAEDLHKITSAYIISAQGTIKLPLLEQEIPASGISVAALTVSIEAAYIKAEIFNAPRINVSQPSVAEVCKISENVVYVGGEVRSSSEVPWLKGMTLMAAIKYAGGFTEFAAINRVKLIRSNKETVYDLREIKPDGSNNPILLDQDTIIVPLG